MGSSSSPQARVIVAPDSSNEDGQMGCCSSDGETATVVVVASGKNKHVIHASSDGGHLLLDGADHENVTLL